MHVILLHIDLRTPTLKTIQLLFRKCLSKADIRADIQVDGRAEDGNASQMSTGLNSMSGSSKDDLVKMTLCVTTGC